METSFCLIHFGSFFCFFNLLGFRESLSCEHALNYMLNDWRLSVGDIKSTLAIFLDLRNTFDTVDQIILASKSRINGMKSIIRLLADDSTIYHSSTLIDTAKSVSELLFTSSCSLPILNIARRSTTVAFQRRDLIPY